MCELLKATKSYANLMSYKFWKLWSIENAKAKSVDSEATLFRLAI